ncbi:uncharacterized protein LOC114835254 [Esox lucius]|uniref:uncharacterized protein LOC114835254 n=1 Tax=Esox lucius TaxID=8010 RepID=UPI0014774BA5|nr:uncharacterized protein LOC114835254 [Esox lucius]
MGTSREERCSSVQSNDSQKTFIVCARESNNEVDESRSASENMKDEHRIGGVLEQNDNLSISSINESDFLSDDEDYESWAASENMKDEHGVGAVLDQNDNLSICSFNESDFLIDDDYNISEYDSDTPGESDMNSTSLKLPQLICVAAAKQPNSTLPASVSTLKEVSLQTDVVPAGKPLEEHLNKEQQSNNTQEDILLRVNENPVSIEHFPDEGLKKFSGGEDISRPQGKRQKKHGGCFRWIGEWLSKRKGEEMRDRGRTDQKPGPLIVVKPRDFSIRTDVEVGDLGDRLPELEGRNQVLGKCQNTLSPENTKMVQSFDIPCPMTPPSHTLASLATIEYIPHPNRARLAPITNVSEKGRKLLVELARDSQRPHETNQTVKDIKKAKKHRKRKKGKAIERQQEKVVGAKEKKHIKKDKISLRKRFLQWLLPKMCCMRK